LGKREITKTVSKAVCIKNRKHCKLNIYSVLFVISVDRNGEVSNFLLEDFETVLKFMDTRAQKRG